MKSSRSRKSPYDWVPLSVPISDATVSRQNCHSSGINPWAAVPFNRDDGFTTTTVRDDDGEIIRNEGTLRAPAVFSLDPAWPFFPEM